MGRKTPIALESSHREARAVCSCCLGQKEEFSKRNLKNIEKRYIR